MNNSELKRLLKSVPIPSREPEFWEQLPRRISAKTRCREIQRTEPEAAARWPSLVAWGFSLAAICLVLGFAFAHWPVAEKTNSLLHNKKLVREVLGMFPNQIQAIIQDENGVRLVLSEEPTIPKSTPLWINICESGHCRSIITFSGQTVRVAGQPVEVLADEIGRAHV